MPSSQEFQASFAASAAEAAEAAPEPEFVEAGGRRLRYLVLGDAGGTPILFIHGFGGDLNNWLFNQPPLSEQPHDLRHRPARTWRLDQGGRHG